MYVLVIGGTGFIGPSVVRELVRLGHSVAVLHRGKTEFDLPAEQIIAERADLAKRRLEADIVVDLILSSGKQAEALMNAFRGQASRIVAASSMDVYRACGITHGLEEGPLEPVPLTEDSALRTKLQTYPAAQIKILQGIFGWLDDDYDKIPVERAVMGDRELPGTVLRLPMIYGPRDPLHRFRPIVKRIDDGRPAILLEEANAMWQSPRGYVDNVAAAIALAAVSPQASGRIYNVAESPAYTELEWARKIAHVTSWQGRFVILPKEKMPAHLATHGNAAQHWSADSSRIRRELGYQEPVTTHDAIRRTVEWERSCPQAADFDYASEDAALAAI